MFEAFSASSAAISIASKAAQNQEHGEGDYINPEDGLLYCGTCHTPKEYLFSLPQQGGGKRKMKVPVMCRCRQEHLREQERKEEARNDAARVQSLKAKSMMDPKLQDATFDRFRKTADNERVLKLCERYTDKFDEMLQRNQGLLFWGDVGTGKTFCAACIANTLLARKVPVVMTSFVKLLSAMQGFRDDDEKLIAQLNEAKLLIIDDLGAERGTETALEKVYNIIDSRYRQGQPMILTTNLKLDEMKQATEMRYARIYDRIFEVCYPVQFKGRSFRKQEASKRFQEMKEILEG